MEDVDIEVTFDSAESAVMKSKDKTFIFYLNIRNNLSKQVKVEAPLATYLTVQGEEIEQDYWLGGLVNGGLGATIRSGAFKKMGVVIDQLKLKKILSGDRLYVTINVMKPSQRFNFGFVCSNESGKAFSSCESNQEAVEPNTVRQSSEGPALSKREITDIVERLELLEEKFGIAISGLYATCEYIPYVTPPYHEVIINFDVTSLGGGKLEGGSNDGFKLCASAYNSEGQLLKTETTYLVYDGFMGFESKSIRAHLDQVPARIRLSPTA